MSHKAEVEHILYQMASALDRHLCDIDGEKHLVCPHDLRVHGRSVEAVLPLIWLSEKKRDPKILQRARQFYLAARKFRNRDGGWENDLAIVRWPGTTVFWLDAMGCVLNHYASVIGSDFHNEIRKDYEDAVRFIIEKFEITSAVTNYTFAAACVLIEAQKILGPSSHCALAIKNMLAQIDKVFDRDALIFGEGYPRFEQTKAGFRPTDPAYNIDESLLYLYRIAQLTEEQKHRDLFVKSLVAHWPFFLADGAIDNSAGSRAFKWTYWGSRTTRGPIEYLLAHEQSRPEIKQWLGAHLALLQSCMKDGLLFGGSSYIDNQATACIQHTIFRAVAFVQSIMNIPSPSMENTCLVSGDFIRHYEEAGILVQRHAEWHVSASFSDFEYGAGCSTASGLPTLVWHKDFGAIFCAAIDPVLSPEPHNSQHQPLWNIGDSTVRIEDLSEKRSSKGTKNTFMSEPKTSGYSAKGTLGSSLSYECRLSMAKNTLSLKIHSNSDALLHIPVLSGRNKVITVNKKTITLDYGQRRLIIALQNPHEGAAFISAPEQMTYNPGHSFIPIRIPMKKGHPIDIILTATSLDSPGDPSNNKKLADGILSTTSCHVPRGY